MEEKVKFGIVGCGTVARAHLAGIRNCKEAEILAVADVDRERARSFAQENDIPLWFEDYESLVKRKDLNAVCICTPSGLHGEVGMAAAQAKKHILCEKPLEITLERANRLISTCRKNGVKLGVIFQRRTHKTVQKVREAVRGGRLGKMVLACAYLKYYRSSFYYKSGKWRGTWKLDGGGALMNQGIHGVDLLGWIMGEVKKVFAYTGRLVRNIEVEDTAVAILRFKNGALGVIEGATSVNPSHPTKFAFHGERGSIILEEAKILEWKEAPSAEEIARQIDLPLKERVDEEVEKNPYYGHTAQIEDFVQAIKENRDPLVPGEEARKSLELILAIYHSARTGEEVSLPLRGGI